MKPLECPGCEMGLVKRLRVYVHRSSVLGMTDDGHLELGQGDICGELETEDTPPFQCNGCGRDFTHEEVEEILDPRKKEAEDE